MRKEDLTVPALILEAIGIILGIVYIGLQIYYGISFHVIWYKLVLNLIMMLLVYVGLTLLSNYPERINRLSPEFCVGKIRSYSLWMIRLVKFVFVAGLLVPCICDVFGMQIKPGYSQVVIGLIIVISVFCEYKILQEIKNQKK